MSRRHLFEQKWRRLPVLRWHSRGNGWAHAAHSWLRRGDAVIARPPRAAAPPAPAPGRCSTWRAGSKRALALSRKP